MWIFASAAASRPRRRRLSQLGNVGPELGKGYIIDSFMVVVLGGVGRWRIGRRGARARYPEQAARPFAGAVLGKIGRPPGDHRLHPAPSPRSLRLKDASKRDDDPIPRGAPSFSSCNLPEVGSHRRVFAVAGVIVPILNAVPAVTSAVHLPDYLVPLLGKFMCFAMVATRARFWCGATPGS